MTRPQPAPLTVNPFGDVEPDDYCGVALEGQGDTHAARNPSERLTWSSEATLRRELRAGILGRKRK